MLIDFLSYNKSKKSTFAALYLELSENTTDTDSSADSESFANFDIQGFAVSY